MTLLDTSVHRRVPIFWASATMRDLETEIDCALHCDLNVMITGEEGVGKKSIAYRIHRQSRRAAARLAVARSPGALDSAETLDRAVLDAMPDGTVLVEDVERMSLLMQARLLGTIARRRTRGRDGRGAVQGHHVRFITATSEDLFELVRFRQFYEPLFYSLNTIHLVIPPLRDHPEDIPVLLQHFFSRCAPAPIPRLSHAARQRLLTYAWPGNVEELRVVVETLASHELPRLLEPDDLPPDICR